MGAPSNSQTVAPVQASARMPDRSGITNSNNILGSLTTTTTPAPTTASNPLVMMKTGANGLLAPNSANPSGTSQQSTSAASSMASQNPLFNLISNVLNGQ